MRVLDVSRTCSYYCGKLFADLGAEVILVEPPVTGVPLRQTPPFIDNHAHIEYGIPHAYFNANKRSVSLDLDSYEGQQVFKSLVTRADLVLEDGKPGWLDARQLGYEYLRHLNPAVVLTSITAFGQTGPYAQYEATDLTLLAHGGLLNLMGEPGRPPTQAAGEQAYGMACMYGAVGSMLALLEAETSGMGQHVDVSIQESVLLALENSAQLYDLEKSLRKRTGSAQRYAGAGVFSCQDGYVYVFAGGMAAGRFWNNLVSWLEDEGAADVQRLKGDAWQDTHYVYTDEAKSQFEKVFTEFARERTKEQLFQQAQTRRIPLCPVSTPADVAASKQLAAREFFAQTRHTPTGRTLTMPGAPYRLSLTPWMLHRSGPVLGQDNADVFAALGLGETEIAQLKSKGVA